MNPHALQAWKYINMPISPILPLSHLLKKTSPEDCNWFCNTASKCEKKSGTFRTKSARLLIIHQLEDDILESYLWLMAMNMQRVKITSSQKFKFPSCSQTLLPWSSMSKCHNSRMFCAYLNEWKHISCYFMAPQVQCKCGGCGHNGSCSSAQSWYPLYCQASNSMKHLGSLLLLFTGPGRCRCLVVHRYLLAFHTLATAPT